MSLPRRAALLAAALLAAVGPSVPRASDGLPTGWAPFESPHGLLILTARLNDTTTLRLLVDSGDPAGLTVVDAAARAAGVTARGAPVQRTIGLFGGEPQALRRLQIDRLDLGEVVLRDLEAFATPDAASFSRAVGMPVDGFIGVAILRRLCLTIDYPARRILIERRPASPFEPTGSGTTGVALRLEAGRITIPVELHGRAGHRMILDTASAATFLDAGLEELTIAGGAGSMSIIDSGGRRRALPLRRLPSLSLGETVFEAIDVALFEGSELRNAGLIGDRRISGIIGADLLAGCRVRLDMPGGRMAIRPEPPPAADRRAPGTGRNE